MKNLKIDVLGVQELEAIEMRKLNGGPLIGSRVSGISGLRRWIPLMNQILIYSIKRLTSSSMIFMRLISTSSKSPAVIICPRISLCSF